ncbi:hypothetical protein CUJ89_02085 [Burkholderia pyrrocinia]|uniref:Uncharacterized protein n=1 Tax=Burkholderia pyrrocinia TaxID=60550 RepID=A0A2Z5MRQ1_BURPY|nr:hypothetical protein [Burkholderia pyrrocinia]AXF19418.1 hypothetical protein CUJ89_02085 [Burkholderia pyrrocinia]
MRYENLMRDARNEALTESTRVRAAFDAIYACCTSVGSLAESLESLALSQRDSALVGELRDWVWHVAPMGPLPMSPSEAVALVERVRNNMRGNRCSE